MLDADLVLEGGGVKGIAMVGALEVLTERGYRFRRVAGTSAGAIVGALVAAGMTPQRLVEVMESVDYQDFLDGAWPTRVLPGQVAAVLTRSGIHPGEHLRRWLAELLAEQGVRTFADLPWNDPDAPAAPAVPGGGGGASSSALVVTAADLSLGRLRHLPWDAPSYGRRPGELEVADAVRASMSIPFLFRPVRWRRPDGGTSWLVDGGVLSNYPIGVFDVPAGQAPRWPTIGIKLSSREELRRGPVRRITGPLSMTSALVSTMMGFYDRMHVDSAGAQARTIFVDTGDISAIDFDLSADSQRFLRESGRRAARAFLDGDAAHAPFSFAEHTARYRA